MAKPTAASPRAFYTTYEASKKLGVSLRTVQLWSENGLLECWKTNGGHRRIPRDSVERLVANNGEVADPAYLPTAQTLPARLNILVVEDEPSLLRLYRLQMGRWKIAPAVATASNGFEAMVRIGSSCPDLLVADLHMPEMDGFRMLHALRSMPEMDEMEIVVVSGLEPNEIEARGGVPGDVRVLPKPIPFDELERIANELALQLGRNGEKADKRMTNHAVAT